MNPSRRSLLASALLAPVAAIHRPVLAQADWPSRPIKLIVAFAPGGFTDIAARLLADSLSRKLGQPVFVDNRAGAAGMIGTQAAAQAGNDGYTILLGTISTHAIDVGLGKKLPYDPAKDFLPISGVAKGPLVMVVPPSLGVKNVSELIARAKASPGKLTYASGGNGTTSHLAAELFKSIAGVDMLHVPYKSPSLATTGILGGQVDVMFDTVPTSLPHVSAGKLVALGVTGNQSVDLMKNVPALGPVLKGFNPDTWAVLFAPAGVKPEIASRLSAAVRDSLAAPEVQKRLSDIGMVPFPVQGRDIAEFIRNDTTRWADLIAKNHITVD
ncbi:MULTISPECIES: Bug family tripartite tricarboxylate transporter substrate binding protein [Ramlibacter]|uniref:Bug family tripartite tricarboxylate transporter substrate binding protein n=1 Tax=Ramlibacter TaxID=174951 RepID=UPI0012F8AA82|nr:MULTISPECIES: tripartite tricarboxylate transporter substrate binding protein [Ramlibacter]MBA2962356.1 tripartite tricarboxylate transporter substrate binding protein [Ramlibacter sp. CGMCC 1.13660]